MLTAFRSWLVAKKYTDSTVKNYVTDIARYLQTLANDQTVAHIFSSTSISNYLTEISSDINYPRYLASLNQFCQYALSQNLISQNPLKKIRQQVAVAPEVNINHLLAEYSQYLIKHNNSPSTIKNYINDISLYINWLDSET